MLLANGVRNMRTADEDVIGAETAGVMAGGELKAAVAGHRLRAAAGRIVLVRPALRDGVQVVADADVGVVDVAEVAAVETQAAVR